MSTLKIRIVGCSGTKFNRKVAKRLLEFGIETAVADHTNVTSVVIVTRLTYLDILAWEIAEEKGYTIDLRCFQQGGENSTFSGDIDVILRVGDDKWSLEQVEAFRESGGMVYEYELGTFQTTV